jgi:hypothetical protein
MVHDLPRSNGLDHIITLGFKSLITPTCDSPVARTPHSQIQQSWWVLIDPWIYGLDHIVTSGFRGSIPFTMITNICLSCKTKGVEALMPTLLAI